MRELPTGIEHRGRKYRVVKKIRGRPFRRSFDPLEEAIRFRDQLHRRLASPLRSGAHPPLTVGDVVARWYEGHRKQLQPGTQHDYAWRIRHDISKIAHLDVADLIRDRSILHDFYWEQLGPQSARNARTILLQAFDEAVLRKEIPENPARGQKLPPARTSEKDIPTPEEVAKIILAAQEEDERWGMFVKITATLGTRRGETCALRWEDFDAARQRVLIRRAACVSTDVLTIKPPKSGRSRTLHIPSGGFWARLAPVRRPSGFLFPGWVRDPVRRQQLNGQEKCRHVYTASRRFGRTVRRLGMLSENGRPYGLHSLRHFVATQLYNQSKDWVQVARFMGHRDPGITMKLYANHVVEAGQRELGALAAAPWWEMPSRRPGIAPA